jgi:chromosome partitioning protein
MQDADSTTSPAALAALARALAGTAGPGAPAAVPPPLLGLREITGHLMPMAPEHLRRVLAAHSELPQGQVAAGQTRRFTAEGVAALRAHFADHGGRNRPWRAPRPPGRGAAVIALADPGGGSGRSTLALNLAVRGALAGWRVLLVDADPRAPLAGRLAQNGTEDGVLGLFARQCGLRLVAVNEARMDRGEAPLPFDEAIAAGLDRDPRAAVQPTPWPGLTVIGPGPAAATADLALFSWMRTARGWMPWRALTEALEAAGLCAENDLVLCDAGRGLGPLALSVMAGADGLVLPVAPQGQAAAGQALAEIAAGLAAATAEARLVARALGPRGGPGGVTTPRLLRLVARAGGDPVAFGRLAVAAGGALLPAPMPELPGAGPLPLFAEAPARLIGRAGQEALWSGIDALWAEVAGMAAALWA